MRDDSNRGPPIGASRAGWVTTYRGDDGHEISVPERAVLAGPKVIWKHVDGPLMHWAGNMHWLTWSERLGLFLRRTTLDAVGSRRWPHLTQIRAEIIRRKEVAQR